MITCRALFLCWHLANLELDAVCSQLVQLVLFLRKKEDRLAYLASALAILDAAKVDALDLGHGIADALGIGHATRDDEQLVLIGNAALERLDAVVDGLDDKLHALGLCQTQRGHLEAIRRGLVVCHKNAVGADGLGPRKCNLTVKKPVVDSEQLDHSFAS